MLAAAVAEFFRGVLQGIVAFLMAKGTAAVAARVPELAAKLRSSKLGAAFAEWVERNWAELVNNPKLKPPPEIAPQTSGGAGGPRPTSPAQKPSPRNKEPVVEEPPPTTKKATKLHVGKQGKHVPGHNNHQPGKSELTDPSPQRLLDDGAGTGQQLGDRPVGSAGSKERVDFGKEIGNYVDPATGEKTPTTMGLIHYGSDGAHIVPARPVP